MSAREPTIDETDRQMLARYLERSADYHEAHGGLVTVAPPTASRFGFPPELTVSEARKIAALLTTPTPVEVTIG